MFTEVITSYACIFNEVTTSFKCMFYEVTTSTVLGITGTVWLVHLDLSSSVLSSGEVNVLTSGQCSSFVFPPWCSGKVSLVVGLHLTNSAEVTAGSPCPRYPLGATMLLSYLRIYEEWRRDLPILSTYNVFIRYNNTCSL